MFYQHKFQCKLYVIICRYDFLVHDNFQFQATFRAKKARNFKRFETSSKFLELGSGLVPLSIFGAQFRSSSKR